MIIPKIKRGYLHDVVAYRKNKSYDTIGLRALGNKFWRPLIVKKLPVNFTTFRMLLKKITAMNKTIAFCPDI